MIIQVLMVIIACGGGVGQGCAIATAWVQPQSCANMQAAAKVQRPVNAGIAVYCITSNKDGQ